MPRLRCAVPSRRRGPLRGLYSLTEATRYEPWIWPSNPAITFLPANTWDGASFIGSCFGPKAAVDDRSAQHARCGFCQIHHDVPSISTAMRWLAARIHAVRGSRLRGFMARLLTTVVVSVVILLAVGPNHQPTPTDFALCTSLEPT